MFINQDRTHGVVSENKSHLSLGFRVVEVLS